MLMKICERLGADVPELDPRWFDELLELKKRED